MAELTEQGIQGRLQGMSWEKIFRSTSTGHRVMSKVDQARQEGYDEGYAAGVKNEKVIQDLPKPEEILHRAESISGAELRGYIQALASTVLAIEEMPPKTGRKQILAVIEDHLKAKREEAKETQAQEVRGD